MKFIVDLSELISNGLTLQEALRFEMILYQKHQFFVIKVSRLYHRLEQGFPLHQILMEEGFNENIVSELKLCKLHGKLSHTLETMSYRLKMQEEKWKEFLKVITYPIILLLFIMLLLFVMKYCLFPQVTYYLKSPSTLSFWLIDHCIVILCIMIGTIFLFGFGFNYYLSKLPVLVRRSFYLKIPFIAQGCRLLSTYRFCNEWGTLLTLGVDTQHILKELQTLGHPLWIQAIAKEIEYGMHQGQSLANQLEKYPFFEEGLIRFIQKGEIKGKLGDELLLYANYLWKYWMRKLEIWMQWIQPLVFIFIGVMIINLYLSLLLPMYNSF